MVNYAEVRARVVAAVDSVYAEPVRIYPQANGRKDTSRTQADVMGMMRVGDENAQKSSAGGARDWLATIAAGKGMLTLDRRKYAALDLRDGDRVQATSRVGRPIFVVESVQDRDDNRLLVTLTEG